MKSSFEIEFSGYFRENGVYFQGDSVTGTLYLENFQHINITGKNCMWISICANGSFHNRFMSNS